MDQQLILAVDDKGKFLGYIPKKAGHLGKGRRHLAITVLLQNSQGQVLLQKRKHQIFDNMWDLTGATHPIHKDIPSVIASVVKQSSQDKNHTQIASSRTPRNDNEDETLQEATLRCLEEEWGIKDIKNLREMGVFNYFAQDGGFCENEHCFLMAGQYDGKVSLNPQAGYEYKWMDREEFFQDIQAHPQKYTPWAKEAVKVLKNLTEYPMI